MMMELGRIADVYYSVYHSQYFLLLASLHELDFSATKLIFQSHCSSLYFSRKMQSLSLLLSLTLLLVTLFYIVAVQEESDKAETVSIHPWQYCQGCKYTVELYAKVAADRLKQQKKAGGPAAMAGEEILGTLCEDPAFFNMQSYMRWSCMKVLGDNMNEFLAEFAGQFTATDLMNKADNFKRARRVSKPHVLMKASIVIQTTIVDLR